MGKTDRRADRLAWSLGTAAILASFAIAASLVLLSPQALASPGAADEPPKQAECTSCADEAHDRHEAISCEQDSGILKTQDGGANRIVYITRSGSRYHYRSTCSNMQNPIETTLAAAHQAGYQPCATCVRDIPALYDGSIHRLYNPNTGEHFYTMNHYEASVLNDLGWDYEGIGWKSSSSGTGGLPVFRLYNPNAGEHHYTMDDAERAALERAGWTYESIGWYSDSARAVPLFREYNPNAFSNNHNYTASYEEHTALISRGWRDEGIGWYGVA